MGHWVSESPATNAATVTPSDTTILGCRGLYVGGAGNLTVDFQDGNSDVAFVGVAAGSILDIAVKRVKAATTATNIVALY